MAKFRPGIRHEDSHEHHRGSIYAGAIKVPLAADDIGGRRHRFAGRQQHHTQLLLVVRDLEAPRCDSVRVRHGAGLDVGPRLLRPRLWAESLLRLRNGQFALRASMRRHHGVSKNRVASGPRKR